MVGRGSFAQRSMFLLLLLSLSLCLIQHNTCYCNTITKTTTTTQDEFADEEILSEDVMKVGTSSSIKRSIDISNPSYIPMGNEQVKRGNLQKTYSFIMHHLDPLKSRFLIYPYPLAVNNSKINFTDGAVISITPDFSDASGFAYLANSTNMTLTRTKALYDINIAILQIQENLTSTSFLEYTYDAYSYCGAISDWIGGKYVQCWRSSDYRNYLVNVPNSEPTSVVYVNEKDIQEGFLLRNGVPRFGILIVPDINDGSQNNITRLLTPAGVNAIRNYVSSGGILFSSGKGAFVVEKLGYFQPNTFNANNYLTAKSFTAPVKCNFPTSNIVYDDLDWYRRSLCFAPPVTSGKTMAGILSAPLVATSLLSSNHTVVANWDPSSGLLLSKDSKGFLSAIASSSQPNSYPYIIQSNQDKGQVIVMIGSPVSDSAWFPWFYNVLFSAMARPLILDSRLISQYKVIPALEQMSMDVQLNLTNLFNEDLTAVSYFVYIAKGINVVSVDPPCVRVSSSSSHFSVPSLMDDTFYYDCSPPDGKLLEFLKQTNTFKLFINDVLVTQQQTDIPLIYPLVDYTIPSRNSLTVQLNYGPVVVNAFMAALLRSDINADPMGIYPLQGVGNYIDNVQYVENKESTMALDVYQYSVFPLITPMVDGSNQASVLHSWEYDYGYYLKSINMVNDYKYPFTLPQRPFTSDQPRDEDFIDWQLFYNRSVSVVIDWDTPVFAEKLIRDPAIFGPSLTTVNVEKISGSQVTQNMKTSQEVTRQKFLPDADNFFEHASQRIQPYLDATQPEPYQSYNNPVTWGAVEPPAWKLNSARTAMRYQLLFGRQDVYWYQNMESQTPLPNGVNNISTVFSLDRYARIPSCVPGLDNANTAAPALKGYFTSTQTSANGEDAPGLKPNEYYNELRANCDRASVWIDPGAPEVTLPEGVSLGHYIVRLEYSGDINSGDDVLYFVKDNSSLDEEWYYDPDGTLGIQHTFGTYREVKVKRAWGADFSIDPNISRKGGRITLTLPNTVSFKVSDPVSVGAITFAPDQVVIQNIVYNSATNQIIIYFKRGNMPNESNGKNSSMQMHIELLSSPGAFVGSALFEEMFYDISAVDAQPEPFLRYEQRLVNVSFSFSEKLVLSLPTLVMKYTLNRNNAAAGLHGSYILPYENIQPFVRQGFYLQELKAHRTVYATVENHPIRDTGLVSNSATFSWISNLGISSIPFREYLTTGSNQMIPSVPMASHVGWKDIWGRQWVQPIRSVFPDVAPIPPPLRNFMMTTTYELLRPDTNERVMQWQSDEPLIVRAQLKVLNNYYKFFDDTGCKANWKVTVEPGDQPFSDTSIDTKQWVVLNGYDLNYGQCYSEDGTYLEATLLSPATRELVKNASHCLKQEQFYEGCDGLLTAPHLFRRPANHTETVWVYSPAVERHYPDNYISPTMWDLTHPDYDDSVFLKAYTYHLDNWIPNPDSGIFRPHNIIAFPIFKGLGYSMSYDNNLTHPKFPGKAGWWSDNLQNRDDTLLGGQSSSNNVSVGATDLLEGMWEPITSLTGASTLAASKLNNLYVCEFNRLRPRVDPASERITYFNNVNYNNVVPVDTTLEKYDVRLYNYACNLSNPIYTPDTISSFTRNYLSTETARDWLYFASNLRGEAKENVNVLYRVEPLASNYLVGVGSGGVEGLVKVQDGGRFVYWNPGLGPNLFEIVDDPVNVVVAKRTDLSLVQEVYPALIPTVGAVVYHHLHVQDTPEKNRTWKGLTYTNNYGYGDATVTIFVGGAAGSTAIIRPGDSTIVTITFYNNAGFDWNLKASAFPLTDFGTKAISATDLGCRVKHTIQVPTQYNFMTVQVPDELKPYVTLVPSDLFSQTPPMVFDFSSNNVLTIRDGFKGDYYYNLTVSASLPEHLRGRMHNLPVTLHPEYFDRLPGPTDPTGVHDYTLAIPDIVFGVLAPDGNVYYTSGYAHNFKLTVMLNPIFSVVGVQYLTPSDVVVWMSELNQVAGQPRGRLTNLKLYWSNITAQNNDSLPFNVTTFGGNSYLLVDFSSKGSRFPFPPSPKDVYARSWAPDVAEFDLLVYTTVNGTINPGWVYPTSGCFVNFTDDVGKNKNTSLPIPLVVRAAGAKLTVSYTTVIYDLQMNKFSTQTLGMKDEGYLLLTATVTNIGNDIAYRAQYQFDVARGVSIINMPSLFNYTTEPSPSNGTLVTVKTGYDLPPNEHLSISLLSSFISCEKLFGLATLKRDLSLTTTGPTSRTMVNTFTGTIDLTSVPNELTVNQTITTPYTIPIVTTPRPQVILSATSALGYRPQLTLDVSRLPASVQSSPDTVYYWYRRNVNFDTKEGPQGKWVSLANTSQPFYADSVGEDLVGVPQVDYLVSVLSLKTKTAWAQSNVYEYRPDDEGGIIFLIILASCVGLALLVFLLWVLFKYVTAGPSTLIKKKKVVRRIPKSQLPSTPSEHVPLNSSSSLVDLASTPNLPSYTPVTVTPVPSSPTAGAPLTTPEGPKMVVKHKTVNIDYLMTGARRVVVKDGNPTGMEVVEEEDPNNNNDDEDGGKKQPKQDDAELEETVEVLVEVDDTDAEGGTPSCGEWFFSLFKKRDDGP